MMERQGGYFGRLETRLGEVSTNLLKGNYILISSSGVIKDLCRRCAGGANQKKNSVSYTNNKRKDDGRDIKLSPETFNQGWGSIVLSD